MTLDETDIVILLLEGHRDDIVAQGQDAKRFNTIIEKLMSQANKVQALKNKINVLRHPGHLPAPVERYCAGIQEALEVLGLWE